MLWNELARSSRCLCFQQNLTHTQDPASGFTRGGALEVRDSGPSGYSPSPLCLPACHVPGPRVVVEAIFSSSLGLVGPAHCWGGVAAVEGNPASDPSVEHGLPCWWLSQAGR